MIKLRRECCILGNASITNAAICVVIVLPLLSSPWLHQSRTPNKITRTVHLKKAKVTSDPKEIFFLVHQRSLPCPVFFSSLASSILAATKNGQDLPCRLHCSQLADCCQGRDQVRRFLAGTRKSFLEPCWPSPHHHPLCARLL